MLTLHRGSRRQSCLHASMSRTIPVAPSTMIPSRMGSLQLFETIGHCRICVSLIFYLTLPSMRFSILDAEVFQFFGFLHQEKTESTSSSRTKLPVASSLLRANQSWAVSGMNKREVFCDWQIERAIMTLYRVLSPTGATLIILSDFTALGYKFKWRKVP